MMREDAHSDKAGEMGPHRASRDHTGLTRDHTGRDWTTPGEMGPHRAYLGPHRAIWDHTGLTWDHSWRDGAAPGTDADLPGRLDAAWGPGRRRTGGRRGRGHQQRRHGRRRRRRRRIGVRPAPGRLGSRGAHPPARPAGRQTSRSSLHCRDVHG